MNQRLRVWARVHLGAALGLGCLLYPQAWAQRFPNLPITQEQRSSADKVAETGVPLSDLAPDAPDSYTVKPGDTLWGVARIYLRTPWRWPELWGMNLQEISNPHLIYPGQTLYLDKRGGRAQLSSTQPQPEAGASVTAAGSVGQTASFRREGDGEVGGTLRLSPRIRYGQAKDPLTTLRTRDIEPFLVEPLVMEENTLRAAPRIVAAWEERVIMGAGDRAYARGSETPLREDGSDAKKFRIFRNAKPVLDPETNELLGYEAEFVGKALMVRGEGQAEIITPGRVNDAPVPATVDIIESKREVQVGDRLAPEPEREYLNFVPRAPNGPFNGRIVAIYGNSAVANAAQSQVVVVNRGRREGLQSGMVLAIQSDGRQFNDPTDPNRTLVKLPDERNGLLMIFKVFDKLSYGLILEVTNSVRIGDRLASPR